VSPPALASPSSAPEGPVARVVPTACADPTILTVKRWDRIREGELFTMSSRIDWAVSMQRTLGFDSPKCPKCAAKMRILATITDHAEVKKILAHLGMRTGAPPRGRARDPRCCERETGNLSPAAGPFVECAPWAS